MKFLTICLILFPLTARAQIDQTIWGYWESIVETHIDTSTGIYVAIIDSQQVLLPNTTRYVNFSIIERLEINTDETILLKRIVRDRSRIFQGGASGKLNDISDHIPGFGYTQTIAQYTGFSHITNAPGSQEILSIWLPDSTSQSSDGSSLIHLAILLEGDSLSTRNSSGKVMTFVRVAWITNTPELQEQIIEGNRGIAGDIDRDGDVDFADFISFAENFGQTGSPPTDYLRTVIRTIRDTIYITPSPDN